MVFDVRHHAAGNGGKRGHHPEKLVSRFTQPQRIPLTHRVLDRRQMIRQAGPKRLANLFQDGGVAAACSEKHMRIEKVSGEW
jgi:hypothetical protein